MRPPYGRYGFAVFFTGYAVVLLIVGLSFYLSWQPWVVQCGGSMNFCGGSHVPPNPYLPQALFVLLGAAALVVGSWSVVMRLSGRSLGTRRRILREVAISLLLAIGIWLLLFVFEFWRNLSGGDLWNARTADVIQGIFFASLVLAPALAAAASLALLWDSRRRYFPMPQSRQAA